MAVGNSSLKVPYDIRPCKQIERRMMVHALQGLVEIGFPISHYQYTGLGSLFFVDFILLRKMIGIYDMLSVEINQEFESRIKFNVPYGDIKITIGDIGECIPKLSASKQHLIWLDYDDVIQEFMIEHLAEACKIISPGSIVLMTVDVDYKSIDNPTNEEWYKHFKEQISDLYLPTGIHRDSFEDENLPNIISHVFNSVVSKQISYRSGLCFQPLFNFIYADGHQMQTIGGMICDENTKKKLKNLAWAKLFFLKKSLQEQPYKIEIPNLTRKERLYLDTNMPSEPGWQPKEFLLRDEQLEQYKKVYNYIPLYAELLM